MLHACVQRFDVTGNLKNLAKFSGTKLDLSPCIVSPSKLYTYHIKYLDTCKEY